MKLLGNGINISAPVAIGAGVVILAPFLVPVVASILRPVAKAAIKGGLIAYEKARVTVAETMESLEDLTAEAKAELAGDAEADAEAAKPKKKAAAAAKS